MQKLLGTLSVQTDTKEKFDHPRLVDEINRVIKPTKPVTSDEIYLGSFYAASNQVNLQGGCFDLDELKQLAELIVDAPVMVGHKKQELPVGRVFKGEVIERNGSPWLRGYFYWRRDLENAQSLKAGIESGIYKECSLGFLYGKPECCICRQDMRHCRHRVHELVELVGKKIKAFYYYKQVEKVLEVSIVYRGAVEGTKVSTLSTTPITKAENSYNPFWRQNAKVVFELTQIDTPLGEIMLEPLYRGIWLNIRSYDGQISAFTPDGKIFHHPIISALKATFDAADFDISAQLIPVKGGSRLPLTSIVDNLDSGRNPKFRLVIVDVLDFDGLDLSSIPIEERRELLRQKIRATEQISLIPSHKCRFLDLNHTAFGKGTAEGIRIVNLNPGTMPEVFELRHKTILRARVKVAASHGGRGNLNVVFDSEGSSSHLHTLNAKGHRVAEGEVIWVTPANHNPEKFEFVDRCLGESETDSIETCVRAFQESDFGGYYHFLDNSGDTWLDCQYSKEAFALKIARLSFPLLNHGRKFWCQFAGENYDSLPRPENVSLIDKGRIRSCTKSIDGSTILDLEGKLLRGSFVVEPMKICQQQKHLFFAHSKKNSQEVNTHV